MVSLISGNKGGKFGFSIICVLGNSIHIYKPIEYKGSLLILLLISPIFLQDVKSDNKIGFVVVTNSINIKIAVFIILDIFLVFS